MGQCTLEVRAQPMVHPFRDKSTVGGKHDTKLHVMVNKSKTMLEVIQ